MEEQLLPPRQAIVAFFSRVAVAPPRDRTRPARRRRWARFGRTDRVADGDYPAAPRSLMDGFAVRAGDARRVRDRRRRAHGTRAARP